MQQEVTSCVMMRHKPLLKVGWGVNGGGSVGTDVFAGPGPS